MFIPQYKTEMAACVDLVANIKDGVAMELVGKEEIRIPYRGMAEIDCGLSIQLKPGYRANISASEAFANRGGFVSSIKTNDFRVRVCVLNFGRENPLIIHHGDKFAQMCIEPILLFEFATQLLTQK
jgi:dUTPase